MGGWGRQFLNITPSGIVLPCHAAEPIPGVKFENVMDAPLDWIWNHSDGFNRFRGTAWMPEPCQSCDRRQIDWGGCRWQAYALTGDASATDPACALSQRRDVLDQPLQEADKKAPAFIYRRYGN